MSPLPQARSKVVEALDHNSGRNRGLEDWCSSFFDFKNGCVMPSPSCCIHRRTYDKLLRIAGNAPAWIWRIHHHTPYKSPHIMHRVFCIFRAACHELNRQATDIGAVPVKLNAPYHHLDV